MKNYVRPCGSNPASSIVRLSSLMLDMGMEISDRPGRIFRQFSLFAFPLSLLDYNVWSHLSRSFSFLASLGCYTFLCSGGIALVAFLGAIFTVVCYCRNRDKENRPISLDRPKPIPQRVLSINPSLFIESCKISARYFFVILSAGSRRFAQL